MHDSEDSAKRLSFPPPTTCCFCYGTGNEQAKPTRCRWYRARFRPCAKAAYTIMSVSDSIAIPRMLIGWCRTLRKCSTIKRSWP